MTDLLVVRGRSKQRKRGTTWSNSWQLHKLSQRTSWSRLSFLTSWWCKAYSGSCMMPWRAALLQKVSQHATLDCEVCSACCPKCQHSSSELHVMGIWADRSASAFVAGASATCWSMEIGAPWSRQSLQHNTAMTCLYLHHLHLVAGCCSKSACLMSSRVAFSGATCAHHKTWIDDHFLLYLFLFLFFLVLMSSVSCQSSLKHGKYDTFMADSTHIHIPSLHQSCCMYVMGCWVQRLSFLSTLKASVSRAARMALHSPIAYRIGFDCYHYVVITVLVSPC